MEKLIVEFNYTVSCGLDSYQLQLDSMPTPEQAYEIIMGVCLKSNIDPYFALRFTAWWNWTGAEKKSFSLSESFRDQMKEETARLYAIQKQKHIPKKTPYEQYLADNGIKEVFG